MTDDADYAEGSLQDYVDVRNLHPDYNRHECKLSTRSAGFTRPDSNFRRSEPPFPF